MGAESPYLSKSFDKLRIGAEDPPLGKGDMTRKESLKIEWQIVPPSKKGVRGIKNTPLPQ